MMKIFATTAKELLLLLRDRTGLLVLFLMPAILVVVITLVQENVMELTGQKKTQVLLLDLDQGELGELLRKQLEKGNLEFVVWDEKRHDVADIQAAVADGGYQVGIVIPRDASSRFKKETARLFQQGKGAENKNIGTISLDLFVDPGIMAGLRSGVTAQLQMAVTAIALEAKLTMLSRSLQQTMNRRGAPREINPLDEDKLSALSRQSLLTFTESQGGSRAAGLFLFNPVQQNVPAWALFGMFFTAIPIAGSILQERSSGIWIRLTALPVSPLVLFFGKALAYIGVCLCQFLLIVLIGAFLFPYIGLPSFTISMNLPAVLFTVLFSSFAACGYGIFLGIACTSYEQASTLGATSVVAAAAIGGVMVPVYAMPHMMQRISIISPLNWGLTAFQDLLLRGYSLSAVLGDLGRLFLFFVVTVVLSWEIARRRQ
ncbi:MAG: ABC transporter permease [Desulfurivibrionaceae bacterium]